MEIRDTHIKGEVIKKGEVAFVVCPYDWIGKTVVVSPIFEYEKNGSR